MSNAFRRLIERVVAGETIPVPCDSAKFAARMRDRFYYERNKLRGVEQEQAFLEKANEVQVVVEGARCIFSKKVDQFERLLGRVVGGD